MYAFLILLAQFQVPEPVGFVNDFAGIIDAASQRAMLNVIEEIRANSRGEVVVVTLRDLEGRAPVNVAVQIGREWRVGAQGAAGDAARNTGVVVLFTPGERPGDGKADIFIATGTGAEGFLTDARVGKIRDAIARTAVAEFNYAAGLVAGVWLIGQAFAEEFEFELTGAPPVRIRQAPRGRGGRTSLLPFLFLFFFFIMAMF